MIKIVLVEDHLVVRNGIKMLLETQENISVVAEANNGGEILSYLRNNEIPDIIITDINMPGMEGPELTATLTQHYPSIRVIILSMLSDQHQVLKAFENGAKGYLIKSVSYDELVFAINQVYKGGSYFCGEVTLKLLENLRKNPVLQSSQQTIEELDITARELEVLQLIGDGYTNMEIADRLFLSKRTVEGHRQNLIDKIGVKNSASLIKFAVHRGLIS